MQVYQDQKIFLGKKREVSTYSYDHEGDVHAFGFQSGQIKLLKFQESRVDEETKVDIVMNENLKQAHQDKVTTLSWNNEYKKLLSVDGQGLMIVWAEFGEGFQEEMVNQSDENRIVFAQWSTNDNYIVICLENNEMILGGVQGERLWSIKVQTLVRFLDWMEDDQTIVVSDQFGDMIALQAKNSEVFAEFSIREEKADEIVFFKGNTLKGNSSRLLIGYQKGQVFMINNIRECDMQELKLNIDILLAGIWNHQGYMFLLSCVFSQESFIYFIDQQGILCQTVKLSNPCKIISFNKLMT